jgi:hypothetical protein
MRRRHRRSTISSLESASPAASCVLALADGSIRLLVSSSIPAAFLAGRLVPVLSREVCRRSVGRHHLHIHLTGSRAEPGDDRWRVLTV